MVIDIDKSKVLEIMEDARPDIDFKGEEALIDGGVLDSFDVVTIISDLNDEFDINIRVHDLTPENFNTFEAVCDMVSRKVNEE